MTRKQEPAWLKKRMATARRCRCMYCRDFLLAQKIIKRETLSRRTK